MIVNGWECWSWLQWWSVASWLRVCGARHRISEGLVDCCMLCDHGSDKAVIGTQSFSMTESWSMPSQTSDTTTQTAQFHGRRCASLLSTSSPRTTSFFLASIVIERRHADRITIITHLQRQMLSVRISTCTLLAEYNDT